MTAKKEFQINPFLSLRLERGETRIYVANELFLQCKFLLLNIPLSESSPFDEISSIDDAAEILNSEVEKEIRNVYIPPEVEFWGHCSNLQAWYENEYDTRLIHSNLAFPLLKRLTEVGDPLAQKVFKQEVIERYEKGTENTREYIIRSGILKNLPLDEHINLFVDTQNFNALVELIEVVWPDRNPHEMIFTLITEEVVFLEKRKVIGLNLSEFELFSFPRSIVNFSSLKELDLNTTYVGKIPEDIHKLRKLRKLYLDTCEVAKLPDSICDIASLEVLYLDTNALRELPQDIGNLKNLRQLSLSHNHIRELPSTFCELNSLERLDLYNNEIASFPKCFSRLKSLQELELGENPLIENKEEIKKIKQMNIKKIKY
jgi:Leucine-rich repeat (LRR) protein